MATVARLRRSGDLELDGLCIEQVATKPHATSVGDFKTTALSEVAVSDSLVHMYPLNGDAKDYASHVDATVYGAAAVTGLNDKLCYNFDGVNDYIKITDNLTEGYTALSTALWIKPSAVGTQYRCALHKSTDSSIGSSEYWAGISLNGFLISTIGAQSGVGWAAGETSIKAVAGTWYHLVATWNGATVKVYVNGNEVKSYALATKASLAAPTRFGSSADGTAYQYSGLIQDVRLYSKALSAAEVRILYDLTTISQMKLTSSTVFLRGEVKEV